MVDGDADEFQKALCIGRVGKSVQCMQRVKYISSPNALITLRASIEWILMCSGLQGLFLLVSSWVRSVGEWPYFPPVELKRACRMEHLPELALDFVSSVAFNNHHKHARHPSSVQVFLCSYVVYISSFLFETASSVLNT